MANEYSGSLKLVNSLGEGMNLSIAFATNASAAAIAADIVGAQNEASVTTAAALAVDLSGFEPTVTVGARVMIKNVETYNVANYIMWGYDDALATPLGRVYGGELSLIHIPAKAVTANTLYVKAVGATQKYRTVVYPGGAI